MKKIIMIEGMNCGHCAAKVEQALGAIDGVTNAKVTLKKKCAVVTMNQPVADEVLKNAVDAAGFQAISVEKKRGLFG
ncbi:MAG: heavy-metal-associated domain-containing protein [Ruminococcaceae bacterium]|nr:heavy-metal-associated domain-containing protein [Oscillospiraceae bacterium]